MSETRKVVRREPEVFHVEDRFEGSAKFVESMIREHWSVMPNEHFNATFIESDQAADIAWNAVIEKLIADAQNDLEASKSMLDYAGSSKCRERLAWIKRRLRPIAPATDAGGETG